MTTLQTNPTNQNDSQPISHSNPTNLDVSSMASRNISTNQNAPQLAVRSVPTNQNGSPMTSRAVSSNQNGPSTTSYSPSPLQLSLDSAASLDTRVTNPSKSPVLPRSPSSGAAQSLEEAGGQVPHLPQSCLLEDTASYRKENGAEYKRRRSQGFGQEEEQEAEYFLRIGKLMFGSNCCHEISFVCVLNFIACS